MKSLLDVRLCKFFALPACGAMLIALLIPLPSSADEPGPGLVYPRRKSPPPVAVAPAEIPRPAVVPPRAQRVDTIHEETECEWGMRIAGGVPVWFFDKEGNTSGAGAYLDVFNTQQRLNFRVGVEGRHMYLGQDAAQSAAEFTDKTPRITYIRIPFSVEYIIPTGLEATDLFIGGGPDIVHTANDISSTSVGGHLSARINYAFYGNWGVALEGGYMWGDANRPGKDVNLDGAYITPTLNYTF